MLHCYAEKNVIICYRCTDPRDDPYAACFGCENAAIRSESGLYDEFYETFNNYIDRQGGERFQVTRQSRRLVCRGGATGARSCKLRIDRAMQLRQTNYARVQQFVQSEQYLSNDDVDILRYFLNFFK